MRRSVEQQAPAAASCGEDSVIDHQSGSRAGTIDVPPNFALGHVVSFSVFWTSANCARPSYFARSNHDDETKTKSSFSVSHCICISFVSAYDFESPSILRGKTA